MVIQALLTSMKIILENKVITHINRVDASTALEAWREIKIENINMCDIVDTENIFFNLQLACIHYDRCHCYINHIIPITLGFDND